MWTLLLEEGKSGGSTGLGEPAGRCWAKRRRVHCDVIEPKAHRLSFQSFPLPSQVLQKSEVEQASTVSSESYLLLRFGILRHPTEILVLALSPSEEMATGSHSGRVFLLQLLQAGFNVVQCAR